MSSRDAWKIESRTDVGCLRTLNEDVVRTNPELGLLLVVDGMGGHNAGDLAARVAADALERSLKAAIGSVGADGGAVTDAVRNAFLDADRHVRSAGEANRAHLQMGATAACVVLRDNHAHLGHVGDTRIYRLRGGKLELLTRDHSAAQRILESGMVDEAGLSASRNRHLVTHALGADAADAIRVRRIEVEPGDLLLVCSDGLNDMVDGADIELLLDTLKDDLALAADQLVMVARDCGGHDNISVALVRIDAPFVGGQASGGAAAEGGRSFFGRLRKWFGGAG
ncbi:MAG: serine/threonine-protein phosphatase [Rhodocyclaceae bacterium]|nr:serine/threonine-protein phosphatase [Rhodocyclaceae bacterium]MCL4758441.1 serine/threonine-protein phosphatase [Rhodocyclaceae bacterium]